MFVSSARELASQRVDRNSESLSVRIHHLDPPLVDGLRGATIPASRQLPRHAGFADAGRAATRAARGPVGADDGRPAVGGAGFAAAAGAGAGARGEAEAGRTGRADAGRERRTSAAA